MEITNEIRQVLNKIKDDVKHVDYNHTVKLSKDYYSLIIGEQLGGYLRTIKKREPKSEFDERLELTEFINKSIGEQLFKNIKKLQRISNIHIELKYEKTKENDTKVVDLVSTFLNFSNEGDVNEYIENDLLIQSIIDPNTFVIVSKHEVNGKEHPYPVEIPSKNVIDFNYHHSDLTRLVVSLGDDFHLYMLDDIIVFTHVSEEEKKTIEGGILKDDITDLENETYIELGKEVYKVELYPTNFGLVPAFRLGFKPDLRTDRRTKESYFDPAMPYLKKLVGSVSEFDLANLKHAFPRLFGYEKKCKGQPNIGKHCDGGKLRTDGSVCEVCHGSGVYVPISSMDSVTLPLPKDPKDLHDLSKLSHTETVNVDLLRYMEEIIEGYIKKAEKSVYGVVTIVKNEVMKTATEKILEQESISDSLEPFAKAISKWWVKMHMIGATVIGKSEGIILEHRFPRNLRIQNASEMLDEIKVLKENGVDSVFVEAVQDEIANKRFIDKPQLLKKYNIYRAHKPFNGDTNDTIQYKITNGLIKEDDAILWANFIDIMEAIEFDLEVKNLSILDSTKEEISDAIKIKVSEIKGAIENKPDLKLD